MALELAKLNHRHEALIDWMLTNPDRPLKFAAEDLGYTVSYIYAIRCSDMFKAAYEERRQAVNGALHMELVDKLSQATDTWLEKVTEKIRGPIVSERFLGEVGKTLLAARYGGGTPTGGAAAPSTAIQVQGNLIVQARERAATLSQGRTALALPQAGKDEPMEVVFSVV
jgi:hypothetical protein